MPEGNSNNIVGFVLFFDKAVWQNLTYFCVEKSYLKILNHRKREAEKEIFRNWSIDIFRELQIVHPIFVAAVTSMKDKNEPKK